MSSFEIFVPDPTTAPPTQDDGHASLLRIADDLAALDSRDFLPINVNIPRACAIALGALPKIQALRPRVLEVFREFPVEAIDKLEDYTLALTYAHLMVPAPSGSSKRIRALYREVVDLSADLARHADVLVSRGYFTREQLAATRRGGGYLDAANDLIALSLMFRQSWLEIAGRTAVEKEDCLRADRLGRELLLVAGRKLVSGSEGLSVTEIVDRRARCFTLFAGAYDRCRLAAVVLRWVEGDADLVVPSIFRKSRPRGAEASRSDLIPQDGENDAIGELTVAP